MTQPRRRAPRRVEASEPDLFGVAPVPEPPPAEVSHSYVSEFIEHVGYPGESARSAVTVSMLTETARDVIEGAFIPIWVRGEISDFKAHRNGHWYFCLRDRAAQVRCVVWNRDQFRIPAAPDNGMQVAAFGRLTIYASRGEMQFTIAKIEADGDGLRRKALEITRARLEADGLLAPERKRALPRFPRVIALVTSPDGAALHDITSVLRRRAANVRLVVVPAAVQGASAPEELCRALDRVNRWGGADLVIIGRGGGALEDLWAFNDERVARAVAACRVPTISAVGHEIDISICDLVADYRAATPSAAAEAATRSQDELRGELARLSSRITSSTRSVVRSSADRLRHLARDLAAASSDHVLSRRTQLETIAGRLHVLSPLATLARGYAVARGTDGTTLDSIAAFRDRMSFELVVRDGVVPAKVSGARRGSP
jgi:exodeoxyribonuclease VII large subunit